MHPRVLGTQGYRSLRAAYVGAVSGDHVLGVQVVLFARGFVGDEVLGFEDWWEPPFPPKASGQELARPCLQDQISQGPR